MTPEAGSLGVIAGSCLTFKSHMKHSVLSFQVYVKVRPFLCPRDNKRVVHPLNFSAFLHRSAFKKECTAYINHL